ILNLYNINQHWWIDRSILPQQDLTEDNQLEQLLEKFNQQYNAWTVSQQTKAQDKLSKMIEEQPTNILDSTIAYTKE
ncbi:44580_t:CDS:1, partial [Gigaspora margarita]